MSAKTWTVAGAGFLAAVALAVSVSPWASSRPDGLEWTLGELGPPRRTPDVPDTPVAAPLPHYTVPGVAREGSSTALAGLIGTAVAFAATYAVTRLAVRRTRGAAQGQADGRTG